MIFGIIQKFIQINEEIVAGYEEVKGKAINRSSQTFAKIVRID
jgi:hypothetical protein